jgi:membrane-bound lytic murein transglycosylase B
MRLVVPGALGLALLLGLGGCALPSAAQPSAATPSVDQSADFAAWLGALRSEAADEGISPATLDAAFAGVTAPLPRVLELDRSQPEFVQTFSGYMKNRLSDARIRRGREMLELHRDLFRDIEGRYGVQPQYLVAFWALESNFGDYTGGFSVIDAGHISSSAMTGSWAGAMGQCQFMPSTFAGYAVDGDGDGRIDIWQSLPDVMHSAANYLSRAGWRRGERWGREVVLPAGFDFALAGTGVRRTVSEWAALGVLRADGSALGQADLEASVILPAGAAGPAFLGYNNFRTTMVWNRSTFYAISVGHLADRFLGEGPIQHMPQEEERALARADVEELQGLLNRAGVDAGETDGVLGSRTRDAVREYQLRNRLTPDGHPSFELLEILRSANRQ